MRIEETVVNIIFDAGKGSTPVESREGISGMPYGELPRPARSGYSFEGWYLGAELITPESILSSEQDVRLTARWIRKKSDGKKNKVMWRQKVLAGVLVVSIVFLAIALAVSNRLVAIYHLTDRYYDENNVEQTERYTIKRQDGVYKLFNRQGKLMETTENGYDSASDGVRYEVYVAETSGNQYLINTSTGEYETYAIVDFDSNIGESLGGTVKNKRVMMFPRIGQDNTYSVEVTNQYGSYKLYRETVENTDTSGTKYTTAVRIEGTENSLATYDPTLFASLCVSCGYTLTMQKLDLSASETPRTADGSVDYSAYGLQNLYDESGNLTYSPAVYTIVKAAYAADGSCTPSDTSYTVYIGDAILSGAGYYAMLKGRDAVYIVSSDIQNTVLQPVESLVTPATIYPMTVSTYVMVYDFILGTITDRPDMDGDDPEAGDDVDFIAVFDFVELAKRENTIYSSVPYWVNENLKLMNGYQFNNDSVSTVLGNLYQMEYIGCRELNPTEEDFDKYGFDKDIYMLWFKYDPEVANGGSDKENWVDNILMISQKTEDGTYFVYSFLYDMIVEVDQYYLSFLEWPQNKWYHQYFFQNNIAYMKNLTLTMGDEAYRFDLDNQFSYAFYDNGDGTGTVIDLTKGTVRQQSDGTYIYTVTKTGAEYRVYFMDFTAGRTYRDEDTDKIMYRSESGVTVEVTLSSTNMKVRYQHNGDTGELDYIIENTYTTDTGTTKTETVSALSNFRRLYSKLLWYSIEGDVNSKELGSDVATYVANHSATAEIRYSLEDMAAVMNPENYQTNNQRDVVIRLYQYTERKMLLTIEVLDGPDAVPDPAKAQGSFYVLASEMIGIMSAANDLLNQVLLPSST